MLSKLNNLVRLKSSMAFFNSQISSQYMQKCCRYNQNGQPMPEQRSIEMFAQFKQYLQDWKLRDEGRRLVKHLYVQDYVGTLTFLKEIVTIDSSEFQQCPSYRMDHGQLLTLELQSFQLKGLSQIDFRLAIRINAIDHNQYGLLPIKDQNKFREEFAVFRMKRQSERIRKMLEEDLKNRPDRKKQSECKSDQIEA